MFVFYSREQPEYGIDGEVEEFDDRGETTGLHFFVQLKGTDKPDLRKALAVSVDLDTASYYRTAPLPLLMVRWHAPTQTLYARWFHQHDPYYGRGGKKTLTFRWQPEDSWGPGTPAELAADARAFLELRKASLSLPRPLHLVTDGAFGLEAAEIHIALRAAAAERPDVLEVRGGPPPAGAAWIKMSDTEIVANLAKVTAATLHFTADEAPAAHGHQVAIDALVVVGLAFEHIGQADLASRLAATYLARSSLAHDLDVASALSAAMSRAHRITEALTLSDELDDPADAAASQAAMFFTWPALYDWGSLSDAQTQHHQEILERRVKRRKETGDQCQTGQAYMNLATFQRARGQWDKAVSFYEQAAKRDPAYLQRAHYWYELGGALWGTRQYLKGADAYARSIELGTLRPNAPALQADCLMFAGRYNEALGHFAAYNADDPDDDGEYRLKAIALEAIVHRLGYQEQTRRTKRALQAAGPDPSTPEDWMRQSLAQLDHDALWGSAWFNVAVGDRDSGDPNDALSAFIAATILIPEDLQAWQNAMVMAFTLGKDAVLSDLVVVGKRMAGDQLIDWMLEITRHDGSFPRDRFVARLDEILTANPAPPRRGATLRLLGDDGAISEIVLEAHEQMQA